jgi:ABC-type Mn2+/Zn2+ transport system ATPase subunit
MTPRPAGAQEAAITKTLLRFEHAALGYGKTPVLTGVDFALPERSFVGILGHNGSGKTTMLKTILGLIPSVKGEVSWTSGAAPKFGYVPQKERLDPIYPLSSYAVAEMGTFRKADPLGRLRGDGARTLVKKCLEECGALGLARKPYSSLSGGQKQRVLIARALAAQPDILALDEPMAGIDITTQKALLDLLGALKKTRDLTILMVSHRVQAEKDLFTHIVWCDEGKAHMGTTEKMLSTGRLSEIFRSEL